jgi:hypothetical protein
MKKFKNWTQRPITRGDYLKWAGISVAASLLMYGPFVVKAYKVNKELKNSFNELDDEVTE